MDAISFRQMVGFFRIRRIQMNGSSRPAFLLRAISRRLRLKLRNGPKGPPPLKKLPSRPAEACVRDRGPKSGWGDPDD